MTLYSMVTPKLALLHQWPSKTGCFSRAYRDVSTASHWCNSARACGRQLGSTKNDRTGI